MWVSGGGGINILFMTRRPNPVGGALSPPELLPFVKCWFSYYSYKLPSLTDTVALPFLKTIEANSISAL